MKYFFDTEFLEDGKTIELISIGIVAEDGRELYLVNEEAPWSRIVNDKWLRENVVPHLPLDVYPHLNGRQFVETKADHDRHLWDTRLGIKDQILEFVDQKPEFWAYYADYDWVVFCQLFGRMIDLPKGFPMYCRDLKQEIDRLGIKDHAALKSLKTNEHHALADARWNKAVYEYASRYEQGYGSSDGY